VGRHQKPDVEKAIQSAESLGWAREERHSGHLWGFIHCGKGCRVRINSTPRNQGDHAKDIRRAADKCPHQEDTQQ
jgi:hypothetical protein